MDLSPFCAASSARLSHLSLEGDRAFPAWCCASSARVVEAIGGIKECLNGRGIIAMTLATHPLPRQRMFPYMRGGHFEAALA
jgi:hypothetical protein